MHAVKIWNFLPEIWTINKITKAKTFIIQFDAAMAGYGGRSRNHLNDFLFEAK